ncbi:transcription factor SRM1-like [Chenopodium quinoa]|uniref:Myb-like domain-containing protein n=1 Tax=Chenopodium quinoa TaxID=63459 RepID=A0A803KXG7_CHEQI|nr:transcription factor SRM1-like [Chenopodium quinoa]
MGWSFEEDKVFENAIAELGLESQNLVQEIALRMPGKTIEEIQTHIDELMHDVMMIEAGLLDEELDDIYGDDSSSSSMSHGAPPPPCQGVVPGQKRKGGGVRWTEDEHE